MPRYIDENLEVGPSEILYFGCGEQMCYLLDESKVWSEIYVMQENIPLNEKRMRF